VVYGVFIPIVSKCFHISLFLLHLYYQLPIVIDLEKNAIRKKR